MKLVKMMVVALGLATGLLGLTLEASGEGFPPAGGTVTCLAPNTSSAVSGGISVQMTAAVEVTGGLENPAGNQAVDFIIRAERAGVLAFFRLHLVVSQFLSLSNEEVACLFLDPAATGDPAVEALVNGPSGIKATLGIPANRRLVITERSITKAESPLADRRIPGTTHGGTLADVQVFAIE